MFQGVCKLAVICMFISMNNRLSAAVPRGRWKTKRGRRSGEHGRNIHGMCRGNWRKAGEAREGFKD